MRVGICDVETADLDWCADLKRAWDPVLTRSEWRRAFAGEMAPVEVLRIAVEGHDRLGVAAVVLPIDSPHPLVDVHVAPEHQGRGVGSALFAELRPLIDRRTCTAGMLDKDPRALKIVQAWGFEVVSHGIDSRLGLQPGGAPPGAPVGARLRVVAGRDVAAVGLDLEGCSLPPATTPRRSCSATPPRTRA